MLHYQKYMSLHRSNGSEANEAELYSRLHIFEYRIIEYG